MVETINASDILPALPEILLLVGALALLMMGVMQKKPAIAVNFSIAIGLLMAAGIFLIAFTPKGIGFFGAFVQDDFSIYMKLLVLMGAAATLLVTYNNAHEHRLEQFEYAVLVLLATVGMMMMISANDLMALYVGLELQSLALYVMAAMKRDSSQATEAGLKYFVLGALSSGLLLYGISLIYGFTGQIELGEMARILQMGDIDVGLTFGLVFLIAGFAFKVSAAPFHMWTPDVYEGAPTPVTAFFAAAPKVAAMAMLVRVLMEAFSSVAQDWQQVIVFICIVTMILAAFAAIGQSNLKRLIAYSSIGHMGFALVGLAATSETGVQAVTIYITIYMIMTLGVFAAILALRTDNGAVTEIEDIAGLSRAKPMLAAVLALFMFSLIGLPPLAGFFAKWEVFRAAIDQDLILLAIIGVLASAIGAFYYLRVIKLMYFDEPQNQFLAAPMETRIVYFSSGLFVLFYVFIAGFVSHQAGIAAKSLVG